MALVQIQRGAFPQRYGVKTTNYQYTERGQRQTLRYVYTETDTSLSPITSHMPTTDFSQVCHAGDPTAYPIYTSGGIHNVTWQLTTLQRTFNAGTAYEFTLTVITGCRAYCNGSDIGGWSFGSSSAMMAHLAEKDYHEYTGGGGATMILDSSGQWTSQCYISNVRSTLHGFFRRAMFETVYDTPTTYHVEYVGDEEVEQTTSALSGTPVVGADSLTVAPYTCQVSLSYV